MKNVSLQIPAFHEQIHALPFSETAPDGTAYEVNNRYFVKDNTPWIPVMGEFHFSRYPVDEWEENLEKMKAGGVRIVATYVFWLHHEEKRGEWDFTEQRCLRDFLAICQKIGMQVWLRIGPWAHGEARNGGFPDWLQHSGMALRTDDAAYLACVRAFYQQIMEQAEGFLLKDNGPIVGIQIENEYGHCGGESGGSGLVHMGTLKKLAQEVGLQAPYYTATGWGGGNVVDGQMLPVHSGYADAPWAQHVNPLPPNENFLIVPYYQDPLTGRTCRDGMGPFTFDVEANPFLTAELGGGLQVTKHRRPLVLGDDTTAMAYCKLASGANLLGYYMYHGGTNPKGKYSTLQESGGLNELPVLSYDFQAVIGEYGELHPSYRKLKNLHWFLQDFGELLAPAIPVFPEDLVTDAADTEHLRWSVRHNPATGGGFLFVNHHQRRLDLAEHGEVCFQVKLPTETVTFPPITIHNHSYGIYPYHLALGTYHLRSSNAQLLCRCGETYVFICAEEQPIVYWEGAVPPMLVLTPQQAEQTWRFGDSLYDTAGELLAEGNHIRLITERCSETVRRYGVGEQTLSFTAPQTEVTVSESQGDAHCKIDTLTLQVEQVEHLYDTLLQLDYDGDRAELYHEGELVADWFTTGKPWRISLKRLGYPTTLTLKLYAAEIPVYYECEVDPIPALRAAQLCPKYTALLSDKFFE